MQRYHTSTVQVDEIKFKKLIKLYDAFCTISVLYFFNQLIFNDYLSNR